MKTIYAAFLCILFTAVNINAQINSLDELITKARPGDTIKLGFGIYTTVGVDESGSAIAGPKLPVGVNIVGKGSGRTIIICTRQDNRSLNVIWGLGDNTIQDVTIDTGVTSGASRQFKFNGVYLQAGPKPNVVKGVTVLNVFGFGGTRSEGFGIITEGDYTSINDCVVTQPKGDYVQAYSINGIKPIVQNCAAIMPFDTIARGLTTCFGVGSCTNAVFKNNLAVGGSSGIYFDTGNVKNLTLEGNILMDAPVGIYIKNQYQPNMLQVLDGITIKNNRILLAPLSEMVVGIALNNSRLDNQEIEHNAGCIDNILITGNYFGYKPSVEPPANAVDTRRAISISSNVKSPVKGKCGVSGVVLSGNIYQATPNGSGWINRNKWGNVQNIQVLNESAIPIRTF